MQRCKGRQSPIVWGTTLMGSIGRYHSWKATRDDRGYPSSSSTQVFTISRHRTHPVQQPSSESSFPIAGNTPPIDRRLTSSARIRRGERSDCRVSEGMEGKGEDLVLDRTLCGWHVVCHLSWIARFHRAIRIGTQPVPITHLKSCVVLQ